MDIESQDTESKDTESRDTESQCVQLDRGNNLSVVALHKKDCGYNILAWLRFKDCGYNLMPGYSFKIAVPIS